MRRGINFPVRDLAPQPGDSNKANELTTSHVELQTVHAVRRFFQAGRVWARTEAAQTYAVNVQFSGNIREQREQDTSLVESYVTQDADTGNGS